MSKRASDLEERLARLKKKADEAEAARVALEKEAQEARKEAETIIPKIKEEVAEIDAKITGLQQEKSKKMETLKLLGISVKARGGKAGARGGGLAESLKELMTGVGIGATLTNKDIQDHLGTASGYVGMLIKAQIEAGNLQRTGPGTFKVTGVA